MKNNGKRKRVDSSLNEKECVAPCDRRGKEHAVKSDAPKGALT